MDHSNEEWRDKERQQIDLVLENQSLETEINLQGGQSFKNGPIDPELENAFLKNVLAFEEAEKEPGVPFPSLFPDGYQFPPVETLSREQLQTKLAEITDILSMHNVEISLSDRLPDALIYQYLTEEVFPNELLSATAQAGFTFHIDGCGGDCGTCFQKNYCDTAREILDKQANAYLATDAARSE